MKKFPKTYGLAVLVFITILVLFFATDDIGRWMYPIQYQEDIGVSAENFNVDPLLIASIIRVESNFKVGQESSKNAKGLMQIMPQTAEWIVSHNNYSPHILEHIHEPDVNIEMGTWYVHWISERFTDFHEASSKLEDEIAVIASAYNAGHNKTLGWLQEEVWDGTYGNLNQIPYGETRHYIKRVIYYYKKYVSFYTVNDFKITSKKR